MNRMELFDDPLNLDFYAQFTANNRDQSENHTHQSAVGGDMAHPYFSFALLSGRKHLIGNNNFDP